MKSALITGAASGIGRACAERMAREGYGVVIADVNLPAAQDLAGQLTGEGLSAIAIHMDVSSEEEVEAGFDRMMEAYGSCDLVMSNAGVQIVHPFEDYPFADWRKMMAIHGGRCLPGVPGGLPPYEDLWQRRKDRIHRLCPDIRWLQAEGALQLRQARCCRTCQVHRPEGAEYGIHTYVICPSFIKTPLVEKQIPEQAASLGISEEEVVKNIMLRDTVDGVFTTVEDVADTLVFLSKDRGALTGQSIRLTHGWAMM